MEKKAYLQVLAAAILWGGIGVFVKVLNGLGLTSMQGVATLLGILIYHEEVTSFKLLGMAAIFGAILLLNIPIRKKDD